MTEILTKSIPLKQQKQKLIDSLKSLDLKQVTKLLRCNILEYFNRDRDVNFCPYQIALIHFNNTYEEDSRAQQSLSDRYRIIMKLLLHYGVDMNKVVNGKTALTYEFEELSLKLSRFNSRAHLWVIKKAILHGMYCVDEKDKTAKCSLKSKGKRLEKSLPLLFILYCLKRKQIATKL